MPVGNSNSCSAAMRCKPIAAGCAKSVAKQLATGFTTPDELDDDELLLVDELLELEDELLEELSDGGPTTEEPHAEKIKLTKTTNNNFIGISTRNTSKKLRE